MRRRSHINTDVTQHLLKIKGLGKVTIHHQLRKFEDHLKLLSPQVMYEYENEGNDRDLRIKVLFERKKVMKRQREIRPGTLKSADERTKVIEASGRLVIPKKYYDQAVQVYDGSQIIIKDLDLKETDEMQRQVQRLIDRVSPPPRLKCKSRVYSQLGSPSHRSTTPASYEGRCNQVLQILTKESWSRSLTPSFRPTPPLDL